MTYYELLPDGTIGQSTPSEKVANHLGLTLQTDREIVYGYDGKKYFAGEEPVPPPLTREEISKLREAYYKEHCDSLTLDRVKSTALGEWTVADEEIYVERMVEIKEEVQRLYPYPEE